MPEPEITHTSCSSCGSALTLVCEPLQGFWGYRTYNEFFCPRCRKRNVAHTTGAVLSARLSDTAVRGAA